MYEWVKNNDSPATNKNRSDPQRRAISKAQAAQLRWKRRVVLLRRACALRAAKDPAFKAKVGTPSKAMVRPVRAGAQLECLVLTLQLAEADGLVVDVMPRIPTGGGGVGEQTGGSPRLRAVHILPWAGFRAADGRLRAAVKALFEAGPGKKDQETVLAALRTTGMVPAGDGAKFGWEAAWRGEAFFTLR